MKLLAIICALMITTTSAFAASPITKQREVLTKVSINGEETLYVAVLNMNFAQKIIDVQIVNDICGSLTAQPGQITCMAMGQIVANLKVPMQKRATSCGSKVYSGKLDQTPVDGMRTEIQVVDNTFRKCKDIVEGQIVVDAETFNPWTRATTTYHLVK